MARKKIREYDAKRIIIQHLNFPQYTAVLVDQNTNLNSLTEKYPWLRNDQLVVKPDQLFGKRKKLGLVLVNAGFEQVKEFINNHKNKEVTIGKATDKLTHFLIEPYIEHEKEYYLCIKSEREQDVIYFSEEGGINVENNWDKVKKIEVPTLTENIELNHKILNNNKEIITQFIKDIYHSFKELDFTYLEINPFTIKNNQIYVLDMVAHVDDCASFKNRELWNNLDFPTEFGKKTFPEEEYISQIDKDSGASLKLTVINPAGKIWSILSGGGASIIYLDTIADLGQGKSIANYGEYSGNPSIEESYQYAKTILNLMMNEHAPEGKILFIAGAIANFTDVEKTFIGIAKALEEYQEKLRKGKVLIYVRRGGPNYEKGIKLIKETGEKIGVPMEVYGPETPMTKLISSAL